MKNTKVLTKKFNTITIIALTIFTLICIASSGIITAQAEVSANPIGVEKKVYSDTNITDDFDDSCVLVVMDKFTSGFNKSHSGKFSNIPFIKAIKDLSTLTGNIKDKLFLNTDNFRQVLKIDLKEHSKQNVINTINQLQEVDGVLWAGVNSYFEPTEFSEEIPLVPNSYYEPTALPENKPIATSGFRFFGQWGLLYNYGINAQEAWNYSTGSGNIRVGIIDSGIADHEDLKDNIKAGWNFIDDNDNTEDTYGHGTNIAGIIGATGKAENGVVGVNWNVSLYPLKVDFLGKDAQGNSKVQFDGSAIVNAVSWAIDNNIDILNMSFGGYEDSEAFKAIFNNFNGLMVCSAGNEANDNDIKKRYPSDYSQGQEFSSRVISVGGTDMNGDIISRYNYGAETVSLFAPGESIVTTCIPQQDPSGYKFVNGTSFATPFVAGVAALLFTKYMVNSHGYKNAYIATQVKSTILNNVTQEERYFGKCVSGGRLNAGQTMKYAQYIPNVSTGYGYSDGWYNWRVRLGLEIESPNSFDFNENGDIIFTDSTYISFSLGTAYAFNAVKPISCKVGLILKDSAGNICASTYASGEIGIISNIKISSTKLRINLADLENGIYTITWTSNTTRKDYSYYNTSSYSFIVDKTQ